VGDLGVLLEPTSVLANAFEHAERIGARAWFEPRVALITGAGPIGLLAALLAHQRGLDTHVLDLVTEGAKPRLVDDLGAHYHSTPVAELPLAPDIVIECTGVGEVVIDATHLAAPGAVVALTGISHSERLGEAQLDALNKDLVLGTRSCSARSTRPAATTTRQPTRSPRPTRTGSGGSSPGGSRSPTGRRRSRSDPRTQDRRGHDRGGVPSGRGSFSRLGGRWRPPADHVHHQSERRAHAGFPATRCRTVRRGDA
jgi:Glucose dehydrogenase C-terminus